GPNAENCRALGGGSAHVTPTSVSHPLAAVRTRLEPRGAMVGHEPGCDIAKRLPEPDPAMVANVTLDVFATPEELGDPTATPIRTSHPQGLRILWSRDPGRRAGTGLEFGARLSFDFTPHLSAAWEFGIETVGPATLAVDGNVVIDNLDAPNGGSFFGTGRVEVQRSHVLVAGAPHRVTVEVRRHVHIEPRGNQCRNPGTDVRRHGG
ncbi:MAG: PA14 domain-containing protein, partial [Actinomycetota bacterium]